MSTTLPPTTPSATARQAGRALEAEDFRAAYDLLAPQVTAMANDGGEIATALFVVETGATPGDISGCVQIDPDFIAALHQNPAGLLILIAFMRDLLRDEARMRLPPTIVLPRADLLVHISRVLICDTEPTTTPGGLVFDGNKTERAILLALHSKEHSNVQLVPLTPDGLAATPPYDHSTLAANRFAAERSGFPAAGESLAVPSAVAQEIARGEAFVAPDGLSGQSGRLH